jgi:hypothetical protein
MVRPTEFDLPVRPAVFEVGRHRLVLTKVMEQRWTVTVDSHPIDASFPTQAEAWEAGVRDAHRLDALAGA